MPKIEYAITISDYTAGKIDQYEFDYVCEMFDKSELNRLIKKALHKEIDSNSVDSKNDLIVLYNGKRK